MARWLVKSDPEAYGFDDLVREQRTVWDGVRNAQALLYLRAMRKGDEVLFYHSGTEKGIVGLAEVARGAYPDPEAGDERLVVVDLKPRTRWPSPVALSAIRSDVRFAEFALICQSRLSVMPVPERTWHALTEMASSSPATGRK